MVGLAFVNLLLGMEAVNAYRVKPSSTNANATTELADSMLTVLSNRTKTEAKRGGIGGSGHPDCPCLKASQTDLFGGTFPEKIYTKKVDGKPHNFLPDCDGTDKEWLFPANLGLDSCTTMAGQAPFCGDGTDASPKTWTVPWMCETPWCVVDAENCRADGYITGNLFPGLSFSYLTCANDESQVEELTRITKMLRKDHRAYHCAGGKVDAKTQADAETIGN